jgi:hypothetical protein
METSISMNAEEKTAEIFTTDPVYLRKLTKLHEQYPDTYESIEDKTDTDGTRQAKFRAAKKFIRFGRPESDAQKERGRQASEHMLKKKD